MPLISVVTSTYNRRSYLELALGSALSQAGVDIEVIVVDNGSTDDTRDFLRAIEDDRLRVIRNAESLGPVGGRNTGLAASRGEWVAFLDDDDVWAPDKLRAQLHAARRFGRDWVYSGCVYLDEDNVVLGGQPPPTPEFVVRELPRSYVVPAGISGMLFKRSLLDGDGLLDPRLALTTDWDIALRCLRHGPPARVNEPHIGYRQHTQNLSHNASRYRHEFAILRQKFADLGTDTRMDVGVQHRFAGSQALRVGARRVALQAYIRGALSGDVGSLVRMAAVPVPLSWHRVLRLSFLSDTKWVARAEPWLRLALNGVAV